MKNFGSDGLSVQVTAPYAVTPGDGMLIGSLFSVAAKTAAQGALTDAVTEGQFDLPALSTDVFSEGATAYWDGSLRRLVSAGGTAIGVIPSGKASGTASARVKLVSGMGAVSGAGNTSAPSPFYHLAYRGAQAGNGPLIDQSGADHDAAPNNFVFPSGWTASQAVALGAYRSPTNANAAAFAAGLPLFKCTTAGTTGSGEPSWNTTIGGTTSDGTAVWTAEKGPWYTDAGGVRQFRSLLDTQLGSGSEVGAYDLGILPWNMAAGDSLIISITSLQNYTSGPTNFNETAVIGNRHGAGGGQGITFLATGQTNFNDLRLRITDGTTARTAAHLDAGGLAQNRPGDGSRRTTTFFVDGQTKRMYLCADGVPRNQPNHYAGVSASDLVAWDADVSAVTGSTFNAVTPLVFGAVPTNVGGINTTTYELGASRFDVLVLPARGLPADIVSIAQWFHNRGEGLLPASLVR